MPQPPAPQELTFEELIELSPEAYEAYQLSLWSARSGPAPDITIHFSSANKEAVRKLMSKLMTETEDVRLENGDYIVGFGGIYAGRYEFRMIENPIGFSIANKASHFDGMRNGNAGGPPSEIRDFLKGKTTAMFYNLEAANLPDSSGNTMLNHLGLVNDSRETWTIFRNATFYGGLEKSEMRINLRNGPDNSLNELIMHFGNSYMEGQRIKEEAIRKWEEELEQEATQTDDVLQQTVEEAFP